MKTILGIIPARYGSTRFPAKALVDIQGQSMIERVYRQAKKAKMLSEVVVATDHPKIYEHVKAFDGKVCMTGTHHQSGTDRCHEAVVSIGGNFDYIINIQGDEPFIAPEQIDLLASCLSDTVEIATLVKTYKDIATWQNPNTVKVIRNLHGEAIYFSRSPLPFLRNKTPKEWLQKEKCYKHIGIYAYRRDILEEITVLSPSTLELAESLEQLRWVENGYTIKTVETHRESIGIDTPEDLEDAVSKLNQENDSV